MPATVRAVTTVAPAAEADTDAAGIRFRFGSVSDWSTIPRETKGIDGHDYCSAPVERV